MPQEFTKLCRANRQKHDLPEENNEVEKHSHQRDRRKKR